MDSLKDHWSFLMVYIAEAHAEDGWRLGNHVHINNHTCAADRSAAADMMKKKFGFNAPMLMDTMENKFDDLYAVWPERYYVIMPDKTIGYISVPTDEFGVDRNILQYQLRLRIPQNRSLGSDVSAAQ